MKIKKGMRALSLLLIVALVGVMFVPAVSAEQSDDQQFSQGQVIDPEGMELTRTSQSKISDTSASGVLKSSYDWIAGTNIYREFPDPVKSKFYSESRLSGTTTPYNVYKVGVRGRAWREGIFKFDKTDENYYSADAAVNYECSDTYVGGHWLAQSDHTFEYPANNDYYYPTTTDDMDL
ncbi:hypothetical protein [Methanolacinia petrolearia]|nr:hypothetical protein [Methanolacinia petrolearia]